MTGSITVMATGPSILLMLPPRVMKLTLRASRVSAKVEEFIAAGVPVIMSIAWKKGDLTGADINSTNGHLLVLVGFDAQGNPIVNDPASPSDAAVQHTYLRSEFEPLWLQASGGTVYLIYPQGASVPSLP